MFDSIQLRSELGNVTLLEDIQYISRVAETTLHQYGIEIVEEIYLNMLPEIDKKLHSHLSITSVNSITEESVKAWNSVPRVVSKTSQLINDSNYVNKDYLDRELEKLSKLTIVSQEGYIFLITVNDDGTLNSKKIG